MAAVKDQVHVGQYIIVIGKIIMNEFLCQNRNIIYSAVMAVFTYFHRQHSHQSH